MTEIENTNLDNELSTKLPIVVKIVDSLKKILEEDKKQKHPLFINVKESVIFTFCFDNSTADNGLYYTQPILEASINIL